jgi:hypothetical protein
LRSGELIKEELSTVHRKVDIIFAAAERWLDFDAIWMRSRMVREDDCVHDNIRED